jgi:predicted ATPase
MRFLIIGAPSSGKTTIITELKKIGHNVVYEAARDYIEEKQKLDPTFGTSKDPLAAQIEIFKEQIKREEEIDDPCFVEAGTTSNIIYLLINNTEVPDSFKSQLKRYDVVFLLEKNPKYVSDGVRNEYENKIDEIELLLESTHRELGYDVIRIPFIPVKDRLTMILKEVSGQEEI